MYILSATQKLHIPIILVLAFETFTVDTHFFSIHQFISPRLQNGQTITHTYAPKT